MTTTQQRMSLVAAIGAVTDEGGFSAVIIMEGIRTADDRELAVGALNWRELPLPLTMNLENPGHGGQVVGKITAIERINTGTTAELRATGVFDLGSEAGREAKRLVDEQILRWLSAEIDIFEMELIEEGACSDDPMEPIDDMASGCRVIMHVMDGRISGAAMVDSPAFPEAVIVPMGVEIPAATVDGRPAPVISVAASTNGNLALAADLDEWAPPSAWFDDPMLEGPTPLTIDADGRVFGHAAIWGTCHIGYPGQCLTPPDSPSGYAHYRLGAAETAEGTTVPVGNLTFGVGHADLALDARATAAHYDNNGAVGADLAAGEDMHGIWVAGALRPDVTPNQKRALRASKLSGDWRWIGGALEMVALLCVNVPGFPVLRLVASAGIVEGQRTRARVGSSGQVMALVAAASPNPSDVDRDPLLAMVADLQRQVNALKAVTDEFKNEAAQRMVASL